MADLGDSAVAAPREVAGSEVPAEVLARLAKGRQRRWVLRLHSTIVYLFLFLPILFLIVFAFNADPRSLRWKGFTTKWFAEAARDDAIRSAVANTFLIAVVAAVIATVLGTLAAFALTRHRVLGRPAYDALFFVPLVIPEVVQAVSLLAFVSATLPLLGFRIGTGLPAVVFGHVCFAVAFALVVVRARLANMDSRLEEASSDLGASPWSTFWRVTFPLALPGIVAGALLAFTLSFDDLAISSMVTSPDRQTLPLFVYANLKNGLKPTVNAVSVFMIVVSLVVLAGSMLLARITARGAEVEIVAAA